MYKQSINIETIIKELETIKYCEVDTISQIQAIDFVISFIRKYTTKKPLALNQILKMDGQPVWIERIGSNSPEDREWALVFCEEKLCRTFTGNIALFGCYGIGWLAYVYPPVHIDRETWEPCYACKSCGNCEEAGKATGEKINYAHPCHSCLNCDNFKPVAFCRKCGRPLTEEAWAELEKRLRG